ncbi:hydroxyethylthiazole kinase [Lactiplantibacillus plantarum]|nr:hydroxyethylthiazole kinase [Lactiplantibacillus plantarum]
MTLQLLNTLRDQNPIVFNIANFVTVQDVANGLNALGASPIMSAEVQEAESMVQIAGQFALTWDVDDATGQSNGRCWKVG